MEPCSFPGCNESLSLHQLETTKKLYGKPYCISHEKYANEEAAKAAEQHTINMQPYVDCGFRIEEGGLAVKVVGQAEVVIDVAKLDKAVQDHDAPAMFKAIQVAGYDYEARVNPSVDVEIKALHTLLRKGAGKNDKNSVQQQPETPLERAVAESWQKTYSKKETPAPKAEPKPTPKELEVVKETLPARREKKELVIGTCEAVAVQYGIPTELANLFFMKMNEGLYIKNPGLLYLAGKKGYSRIEIIDKFDEKSGEWSAECKIYPKISKELLEGIAKLDKEMQKQAFDFMTNPTNGTGRASKNSVKMSTMQPFLREMAQTRAQNRALRAFTGYGGTSVEELPEGQVEVS